MVADEGSSGYANSRLLEIGDDGSLIQIPQHEVVEVHEVFPGSVENRDLASIVRDIERQDQSGLQTLLRRAHGE